MKHKNSLWVEKYRPETLDGYICSGEIKDKFQYYIINNDIPHLLFSGSVGIGKTTAALLLLNNLDCDKLIINASDERGIEVIRTKITNFAKTAGFKKLKVVLLEEADKLTPDAQDTLRFVTEQYSKSTRFIITCNYVEMLSDALKSRFRSISLVPPTKKDVGLHIFNILDKENVIYDKLQIANLVNEHYPDVRHMIKIIQDDSHTGTYIPSNNVGMSQKFVEEIINILKLKKNKKEDFNKIRQIIANSNSTSFIPLFKKLYSEVDNFAPGKQASMILILADMLYKDSFVADKEINMMATIAQLISNLYE
jgi:DNA polymerase III delta prime subunit